MSSQSAAELAWPRAGSAGTQSVRIEGRPSIVRDLASTANNLSHDARQTGNTQSASAVAPRPVERIALSTDEGRLLQLWEGHVLSVKGDDLTAVIRDRTNREHPDEEVVFSTAELDPEDLPLAIPGAVFYWSIRYEDRKGKPRERRTRIRIRRLPGWEAADIARATERARAGRGVWIEAP